MYKYLNGPIQLMNPQLVALEATPSDGAVGRYAGIQVEPGVFNCCGLIGIKNIYGLNPKTWDEKAELARFLYQHCNRPGTLIYVLEAHQLELPMHQFLVEIGAKRMGDEFRNLNYEDHYLSIWIVTVKDLNGGIGKYLDGYGRVRPSPAKVVSPKPTAKVAA